MKKNIAIIMGGYSSEYEISLKSGQVVFETLDASKYNAYKVHIFKNKWVYVDANDNEYPIDKNDFSVTVNGNKQLLIVFLTPFMVLLEKMVICKAI